MKNVWKITVELAVAAILLTILLTENDISNYIKAHPYLQNVFWFAIFFLTVRSSALIIQSIYSNRKNLQAGAKNNFFFGVSNIATLLIIVGSIVAIFNLFGIDIRTLLTSLSLVAVAITILTKEYINDFLVGLYYSFSRYIEINDYVKVGGHKGRILEIEMLKIKLLNDDNDIVILPNNMVYSSEIINYTKRDVRSTSK